MIGHVREIRKSGMGHRKSMIVVAGGVADRRCA
jgi:hypothetical protein